MNYAVRQKTLKDNIRPFARDLLQQDNDPKHTSWSSDWVYKGFGAALSPLTLW